MSGTGAWAQTRGRSARRWTLHQVGDGFSLVTHRGREIFTGDTLAFLAVGRSWLRPSLDIRTGGERRRLYGLNRANARGLERALRTALLRYRAEEFVTSARAWHDDVRREVGQRHADRRWITEEQVVRFEHTRPTNALPKSFEPTDVADWMAALPEADQAVVRFLDVDSREWIARVNESILSAELTDHAALFNTVERSPLTEEQTRAVVCFDNRVQVVAAAGSGKTSVMVGRTAYALKRGLVRPERILLLAFNKAAAEELKERVHTRLGTVGISSDGVTVSTFHAFGLGLIGRATGRKPRAAPWLEQDQGVDMIVRIVDELRESDETFRYRWDIFRLLFARHTDDKADPDGWDKKTRTAGYRTLRGEIVKSEGERLIADWLFLNGVDYRYEHPYRVDVADATHSQYRPDFYYPDVDVWHEHWALDESGNPPEDMHGYAESMAWKRNLHRQHGTTLIESTWAQVFRDDGLEELGRHLEAAGLSLDWNPDRPPVGARPVEHKALAGLVRSFMCHVKSNSLTPAEIARRADTFPSASSRARARWFLDIYWPIHRAWQERLRAEDCVDFEDMLVSAAELLESGAAPADFDLVLVDEFQDVSRARARLVQALLDAPGRFLLAVGDDWQSINRFAGSDVSLMTSFDAYFGKGPSLPLQTTFRCTQSICDVSSTFIGKNPRQMRKAVRSHHPSYGDPILLTTVDDRAAIPAAISGYLAGLAAGIRDATIAANRNGQVTVDILGRYGFDRDLVPTVAIPEIALTYRTIHRSKGLEADYVVIANGMSGRYGFPSQVEEDPILNLAMVDPDDFPHAEERRLMYVALTRARRQVMITTVRGQESAFVAELVADGQVVPFGAQSDTPPLRACPRCQRGVLTPRSGRHGDFVGCSRFPACRHKEKAAVTT